jgi:biopolymer transport protein ExbB
MFMKDRAAKIVLVVLCILVSILLFLKVTLFHKGGPLMVPIILSSIFSLAIILAKMRQFSRDCIPAAKLLADIFERIERQRIKEAVDFCEQVNAPPSRILKEGIVRYDRSKEEIKESMENSFLYEIPVLEENLSILATMIQITPLFGFLGTLVGMIKIFIVIQAKGVSFSPVVGADLACGIWEALISACAGFCVTTSLLIAYHYLAGRVKRSEDEMERSSSELLNFLMERRMAA